MLIKRIVLNSVLFFFFTVLISGLPLYGEDAKASDKNGDVKNTGAIDTRDVLVAFGQAFDPNIVGALSSVKNFGPTMTVGELAGALLEATGGQAGDEKENIAALETRYPDIPLNNITSTVDAVGLIRGIGAVPNSDGAQVVTPVEFNPVIYAGNQKEMEGIRSAAMEQTASGADLLNTHQEFLNEGLKNIKIAVEQTPENAAQVVGEVTRLLPGEAPKIKQFIKTVVKGEDMAKKLEATVDEVVAQNPKTVVESTPPALTPAKPEVTKATTIPADPTTANETTHTPTVVPDSPIVSPA